MYNWAKQPWRTQERIAQIMDHLFDNTPDGISGNEDCGQMSSWFIFSSMGFYPVCPGTNEYIIGKPSLPYIKLNLENGKAFEIKTKNYSDQNIYIQSVKLNGEPYNKSYIMHSNIVNGGVLEFTMGKRANKRWGTSDDSLPYSITK